MKILSTILGLCLLWTLGSAQAAETATAAAEATALYRWIDSDGQVQYTDFEPDGVPSQRIETALENGDSEAPVLEVGEQWQPDAFHDQDGQILPIEHIGPCADARQQLAVLHTGLPIYSSADDGYRAAWRGDRYRGERDYLSDEERQTAMVAARNAVLEACSDADAFAAEVQAFKQTLNPGS